MTLTYIITQMDKGLQALFLFYSISSLIAFSVAKFAHTTSTTKKEKTITAYNLQLTKLMLVVLPLIPIWFFTVKLC
jgi:hypothetical protein